MSFIDVIPYLDPEGIRLKDLVVLHKTPKATLARLINSIHHQGFIDKKADPTDSRANILFITPKGVELVEKASNMAIKITNELSNLMGKQAFDQFCEVVQKCFNLSSLPYPPVYQYLQDGSNQGGHGQLWMQPNSVVKYIDLRLFENNKAHGYDDLQNSHRRVLEHISQHGTRASVIAEKEGLTKQSISDISHVLLQKKYLKRVKDPEDKRAHRLVYAEKGKAMLISAMKELKKIETELNRKLGDKYYQQLSLQSERLWFLLDGQSPDPICSDDFTKLKSIIEPLLQTLLSKIQQNHTELMPRAFTKSGGSYQLDQALVKFMQAQTIPMK
ncbi:hypothetical protein A9Q81_13000 [Gammaproteobacteria bacterium 42_54_T18]|nr:hypothetical protein A9Q81_13000 [Gammaproteobacteria bacterium 42_54_T18]